MTTVQQTSGCDMMPAVYNSSDSSSSLTEPTRRRIKLRFVCGGVASERIACIATDLLPAYTSSNLVGKQTTSVNTNPIISDKSAMAVPADEDIIKKQIKTSITSSRVDEDHQEQQEAVRQEQEAVHQEEETVHLASRKAISTGSCNSTNFTKDSDHAVLIPFQERIESAKRKLHERYEECDKAKKQRMSKMMSLKDVKKLGDGSKSRLKPAEGKKRGGGRKSCLKPAENKKIRYLYNEWV